MSDGMTRLETLASYAAGLAINARVLETAVDGVRASSPMLGEPLGSEGRQLASAWRAVDAAANESARAAQAFAELAEALAPPS